MKQTWFLPGGAYCVVWRELLISHLPNRQKIALRKWCLSRGLYRGREKKGPGKGNIQCKGPLLWWGREGEHHTSKELKGCKWLEPGACGAGQVLALPCWALGDGKEFGLCPKSNRKPLKGGGGSSTKIKALLAMKKGEWLPGMQATVLTETPQMLPIPKRTISPSPPPP